MPMSSFARVVVAAVCAAALSLVPPASAARLAALASGEVDLLLDPPFRDVPRLEREARFRVTETGDIGTQYLGFDQMRAEAEYRDVKGRNPFKDLRVRRAIAQAIDTDAIVAKVLRGQAIAGMLADLPLVPLYRRTLAWAMRPTVDAVIWPNDILELRSVHIC